MKSVLIIFFISLFIITAAVGQETVYYKKIGTDSLKLEIYKPEGVSPVARPAIVFYFGGGWKSWNFDKFRPHAVYFAQRGLVTILVDYRVEKVHGVSPAAALRDAKSSMRYIRANAERFSIDPNQIIASGGSAGGHLAAAMAVVEGFNEPTDDLSISCIPNALVLFNPVIDNGPGGYGFDRVTDYYKDFSPLHNLKADTPPTLFMLGTEDKLIPVETALYYQKVMEKMGLRCDVKLYEGKGHGFFNFHHFDAYKETLIDMDEFLQSLGYLNEKPIVQIK